MSPYNYTWHKWTQLAHRLGTDAAIRVSPHDAASARDILARLDDGDETLAPPLDLSSDSVTALLTELLDVEYTEGYNDMVFREGVADFEETAQNAYYDALYQACEMFHEQEALAEQTTPR